MASIYIPFSTGEGQTAKIAHYIADVIEPKVTMRGRRTSSSPTARSPMGTTG